MKTFLFQGDSITDAERKREDVNNFGFGYPNIVASKYLSENIGEYQFINILYKDFLWKFLKFF